MAVKQYMKLSEARILVYLNQVVPPKRYLMEISSKLGIEYGYLNRLIRNLISKRWVKRGDTLVANRAFYDITELGASKIGIAADVIANKKNGE